MTNEKCPNEAEILAYAELIGVHKATISMEGCFGWTLRGKGYSSDDKQKSLVFVAAQGCNIAKGNGGDGFITIFPERFHLSAQPAP